MSSFTLDGGRVVLHLDSGVCRFKSTMECWVEEDLLRCRITSGCQHVKEFAAELEPYSIVDVMRMPFSENKVYQVGGRTLKHSTCPVPMALLKGFEVAAGLALRRDVTLTFER